MRPQSSAKQPSVVVKDRRRDQSKDRSSFDSEDEDTLASKRVFVGRLPDDCLPKDLTELFE